MTDRRVLVTCYAGFIGVPHRQYAVPVGAKVLGVDNFTPRCDPSLKERRNAILSNHANFELARISSEDSPAPSQAWKDLAPDAVIHLAAQAGVRYSIDHPADYVGTNIVGTFNLMELARHNPVRRFLAASTSSVYGANTAMPIDVRP